MQSTSIADEVAERVTKLILPDLDPVDVLDYLYEKRALSEEEREEISCATSRRKRCLHLVNALKQRQNPRYNFYTLVNSLDLTYGHLFDDVKIVLDSSPSNWHKDDFITDGAENENFITAEEEIENFIENVITAEEEIENFITTEEDDGIRTPDQVMCCSTANPHFNPRIGNSSLGKSPTRVVKPCLFEGKSISSKIFDSTLGFYEVVSKAGGMVTSQKARTCFDRLSTLLNDGLVKEFDSRSKLLISQENLDPDVHCVVLHLQSCRQALQGNFEESESVLNEAKLVSKNTSNPVQNYMNILSVRCLISIKTQQFESLSTYLSEAEILMSSYPTICEGMPAGWILVDKARHILPLLTSKKSKGNLLEHALNYVDRALEQFQREQSNDGPFGFGFALILKASLLLACGEKMNTVRNDVPKHQIKQAAALLSQVEDLDIGISTHLDTVYSITMTDLCFRQGNPVDSFEFANKALTLAQQLDFPEQKTQANARVKFLQPLVAQEEVKKNIVLAEDNSKTRRIRKKRRH